MPHVVSVDSPSVPGSVRSANANLSNVALKSASSLMGLQLLSRLFTFALNQALVRLASPQVFGTASIQFELVLSTILFLSREGVRNTLLRVELSSTGEGRARKDTEEEGVLRAQDAARISNMALLPLAFGIPVSLLTAALYRHFASLTTKSQPFFDISVIIYVCAAVGELFTEPLHTRAMQTLNSSVRIRAEGFGVVAKPVVTFLILLCDSVYGSSSLGLLAFALGQFAYAVVMLVVYLSEFGTSVPFTPQNPGQARSRLRGYFDEALIKVSMAMTAQSLLKHFLTEGDKLTISRFSPLKDQGGYAIAVNYGSLVARVIFQPIEETSRLFFSKTLPSSPTPDALSASSTTLTSLLLLYSHLTLCLLSLVPPYQTLVFSFLLPKRYLNTSAPEVLSAWVYYIPVLAINGVLEAFVSSVSSPSDLRRQSKWMAFFSVLYISMTIMLYRFAGIGDSALVYANIVNLSARILYCGQFINRYFKMHSQKLAKSQPAEDTRVSMIWKDAVPPHMVVLVFGLIGIMLRLSAWFLDVNHIMSTHGKQGLLMKSAVLHVGIGILGGIGVLFTCWMGEHHKIKKMVDRYRGIQRQKVN